MIMFWNHCILTYLLLEGACSFLGLRLQATASDDSDLHYYRSGSSTISQSPMITLLTHTFDNIEPLVDACASKQCVAVARWTWTSILSFKFFKRKSKAVDTVPMTHQSATTVTSPHLSFLGAAWWAWGNWGWRSLVPKPYTLEGIWLSLNTETFEEQSYPALKEKNNWRCWMGLWESLRGF